ncbi:MAG TPA: peptidoglycan-binding protein, partial [Desulfobulbus sp.]|nr:peptidoglycan-binding protein [Desulfobulbus sp.]
MKKQAIVLAAALLLFGCSKMELGSQGAKSVATGSAGGAAATNVNSQLERCAEPFGTLAVNEDHTA